MEIRTIIGFALTATYALLVAATPDARAAVRTEMIAYQQGNVMLDGYLAYDASAKGKEPGVVIFPDYFGITSYAEARARRLAQIGYVVLIADMYGKGAHFASGEEAAAAARSVGEDPAVLAARYDAAFDLLRRNPRVDVHKLVTIGYCFGGLSALGLARSGADIAATVTFHGVVADRNPASAKNIKGHVLVFWGADDPHVTAKDMDAFANEMRATKVDWQIVTFGNTVHSFTVPTVHSATDAYNPTADRRSWRDMLEFLHEVLH